MDHQALVQIQEKLEQEAIDLGEARYKKLLDAGGEAALPPGMIMLKHAIGKHSEAIEAWLKKAEDGDPVGSRFGQVSDYLRQFDVPLLAYITGKVCIGGIRKGRSLQSTALGVTAVLEDQLNHDALQQANPRLYRRFLKKTAEDTERWKHIAVRRELAYVGVRRIAWTIKERLRIGQLLVHLFEEATGLIKVAQADGEKTTSPFAIQATEETLKYLDEAHARNSLLDPVLMPMVVPPRPWTSPFKGGYITKHYRLRLMKAKKNWLEELKHVDMPRVYSAVNAVQETPWRINKGVHWVLKAVWEDGGLLGGLPSRDPVPLPAKNFAEDAPPDDPAVKVWKKEAALVYSHNAHAKAKRVGLAIQLNVAEKFVEFDRLYFPHTLDWRGRLYPAPTGLNPQGDDISKGLLQFADGKPLGTNGAFWLAVHGANCFGVDKVSFNERVQWVQDNHAAIIDAAVNPMDGSRLWCDADSPYCFLAFALEWSALQLWCESGKAAEDFVSYLSVQLDGSCNGLQNFSAMLRDEVGGRATNLVPLETPADIYAAVAKVAQEAIDAEAAQGSEQAQRWVGKMTRKLSKRNTMTLAYGVTRYGMADQMEEELKKLKEENPEEFKFVANDALYIANHNWRAVGKVVVAATAAMQWLQKVASVAAKDGLPIRWTTPVGLQVLQDYREVIGERLDTSITGKRVRLTLTRDGDKLNKRKMSSGISPNFVHSLDAAHLMGTVNLCVENGLSYFSMIHDSFGTHAGSIDVLSQALREAFIEQYSTDVLAAFKEEIAGQLPENLRLKLPDVPPFGTLDLSLVRDSDYFFA